MKFQLKQLMIGSALLIAMGGTGTALADWQKITARKIIIA